MTTARWSWTSLEKHVLSLLQAAEGQILLSSSCLSQTFKHPRLEGRGNGSASLHATLRMFWLKAVSECCAWQRQHGQGVLVGLGVLACYLAFIPVSKQRVLLCLPNQVSVPAITKRTSLTSVIAPYILRKDQKPALVKGLSETGAILHPACKMGELKCTEAWGHVHCGNDLTQVIRAQRARLVYLTKGAQSQRSFLDLECL